MSSRLRTIWILIAGTMAAYGETPARLHGKVIDAHTGEPLAKTLVSIRSQRLESITGSTGRFEVTDVRPGTVELYVSTVGYALLKKTLQVQPGAELELDIRLGQDAVKRTERLTVAAGPFDPVEGNAPLERTLHSSDVRNLSNGLFADPFRSIHSLPGVGGNDDFYAEFGYRGAGMRNIGFFVDGVRLETPFHSLRQVGDLGSVSVLNADVIESVSLLGGAFSAKYADATAAVLSVRTRNAGRERPSVRLAVDCFQTTGTAEGPLGSRQNASWLVSVRKSYLGYLMSRLGGDELGVGYQDGLAKLAYDPAPAHRITLLAAGGTSAAGVESGQSYMSLGTVARATSRFGTARLAWIWTPRTNVVLHSTAYDNRDSAANRNPGKDVLLRSTGEDAGLRHDATLQLSATNLLEAGAEVRRRRESYLQYFPWDFPLGLPGSNLTAVARFATPAWRSGGYAQHSWTGLRGRLAISGGGRLDHFSYTGESAALPRANVSFAPVPRLKLNAAYGKYAQFPGLVDLLGPFANPMLRAQRSTHYQAGLAIRISESARVRVDLYNREEMRVPYSEQTEWRIAEGRTLRPLFGSPLRDSLEGRARGIELSVERRTANRISGWLSYSYGHARYHDRVSGLAFDADFDQRHTVNAYATYRASQTVNISGKYRYTSNFPIVGFYRGDPSVRSAIFWLAEHRNQVRLPTYSRVDVRVSKAYYRNRSKITVYGEIVNLLNRTQRRYFRFDQVPFAVHPSWLVRDTMLPILPSGGVTLEF